MEAYPVEGDEDEEMEIVMPVEMDVTKEEDPLAITDFKTEEFDTAGAIIDLVPRIKVEPESFLSLLNKCQIIPAGKTLAQEFDDVIEPNLSNVKAEPVSVLSVLAECQDVPEETILLQDKRYDDIVPFLNIKQEPTLKDFLVKQEPGSYEVEHQNVIQHLVVKQEACSSRTGNTEMIQEAQTSVVDEENDESSNTGGTTKRSTRKRQTRFPVQKQSDPEQTYSENQSGSEHESDSDQLDSEYVPDFTEVSSDESAEETDQHCCDKCGYKCKSAGALATHAREHDVLLNKSGNVLKCTLCNVTFNTTKGLVDHDIMMHNPQIFERPLNCKLCHFTSLSVEQLMRHMIENHAIGKKFKCKVCGYETCATNANDMRIHMLTHTVKRTCSVCKAKGRLNNHMYKHVSKKLASCNACRTTISKNCELSSHMKQHTTLSEASPYKCQLCNFKSTSKSKLVNHISVHLDNEPYSCDKCSFRSSSKEHLKVHDNDHHTTRTRNICSYKPIAEKKLTTYTVIIKTYDCNTCSKQFISEYHLKRHKETVTSCNDKQVAVGKQPAPTIMRCKETVTSCNNSRRNNDSEKQVDVEIQTDPIITRYKEKVTSLRLEKQ